MTKTMGSMEAATAKKAKWFYPKFLGLIPSGRWGHSACCSNGALYVFGGCCGGLHFSDVLVIDLDTMVCSTLVTTGEGPGPRDSHSAVLVGHKMIVFGGTNGSKKVNYMNILNLRTKEWTRPECIGTPPRPRESHTATLVGNDKIVIFGGSGEGEANYLNDVHILDLNTMRWSSPEVRGDIPVPRDSHSTVAIGNKLFVYGGDCGDRYHGDVDVLDVDTMTWSRLVLQGRSPGPRAGHSAVSTGTKIYIFGGVGDKHYYNDVWVFDANSCMWTQLSIHGQQPKGRFSHTAITTGSDIAIYGGCGEDERSLKELLLLQLAAEHPNANNNISRCKIFRDHQIHEKGRFPVGANSKMRRSIFSGNDERVVRKGTHEIELETRKSFLVHSDNFYPKRRRTANSKVWEIEFEQEEHSLSLSRNSSPSQSDQEQTAGQKPVDQAAGCQELHLFSQKNQLTNNCPCSAQSIREDLELSFQRAPEDIQVLGQFQNQPKEEQYFHASDERQGMQFTGKEQRNFKTDHFHHVIGSEVRGKVDGAFDSGFLVTASVNGKIFRGVLFSPGPEVISTGPVFSPNPSSSTCQVANSQPFTGSSNGILHVKALKHSQQTMAFSFPESKKRSQQAPVVCPYPTVETTSSSAKDSKLRSDLQGVVLTLAGPGSGDSRL